MNKISFATISLMLVSNIALAGPFTKFNTDRNVTNQTSITWRQSDDVQAACEAESIRRGNGGFGYSLEACSFWSHSGSSSNCLIITAKNTDLDTLGHETRHCFQGEFHK